MVTLSLALGVGLVGIGNAQAPKKAKPSSEVAAPPPEPVLEPKAIDLLKASSARLAAARSMMFTAVNSYESPSRLGPPLVYTTKDEVILQRPDKLRVVTMRDGPISAFYYDGKTMTAFAPAENLAATSAAEPTIDAALQAAYNDAAIYFPFTDVIVADPYAGIAEGLVHAFYIGQSHVVGGTTTDIVGIVNKWVFEQIWIGAEDKLPRMARAVFHADPLGLRHQVELSNWQIDPTIAPDTFVSAKAGAAQVIPFARPDLVLPPDFDPRAKGKSSKTK